MWQQRDQVPNGKNYKGLKDRLERYLAIQLVMGNIR